MKAAIDNDLSPLTWPFAYMPTKITIRMSSQNASHQSIECKMLVDRSKQSATQQTTSAAIVRIKNGKYQLICS